MPSDVSPGGNDRRAIARLAAHTSWALTADRTARTTPAREGLMRRFEHEVDPDGLLTPDQRRLRAENARKAFYVALARKSAQARRDRASGVGGARDDAR